MKLSDWLLNFYKKKFGDNIVILQHDHGPTWNDGGAWNDTIIRRGDEILRVYMPSDYQVDRLEITKMKAIMKETYTPV